MTNRISGGAADPELLLHPTPQLARDSWIDLCGEWGFSYDDHDLGLADRWHDRTDVFDRCIVVPFPPESPASGIGDTTFHPIVWYRREIDLTLPPGKRVVLHFGAVDYRAQVWVNGRLAVTHEGGQTPFVADITAFLQSSNSQTIVVRAEDRPDDLAQPRGKQDWQETPHAIWYHRTTGIWQPVWIETVEALHIVDVYWQPDVGRHAVGAEISLATSPVGSAEVTIRLSCHDRVLAETTVEAGGSQVRLVLSLDPDAVPPQDLLWSPEHPVLIDADIVLVAGDETLDSVRSYLGLREVGTDGTSFLLNGEPRYLRFVLSQGYWPEGHLAASAGELRQEVVLARGLGFNGVRVHQKVEDPRFLYWCDRLGLMVWGEMANAFVFTPQSLGRLTREWQDVVRRDRSHPCVIAWVPFNESWGVPDLEHDAAQRDAVRTLYHLTKVLDSSRPVLGNDGWEFVAGDVLGIHDYAERGQTLRRRYGTAARLRHTMHRTRPAARAITVDGNTAGSCPVVLSEFGGISWLPAAGVPWYGYGTVPDASGLAERYSELLAAVTGSRILAGFCYTQLTDTAQETNGLLTADRQPKLDPEWVRSVTQGDHQPATQGATRRSRRAAHPVPDEVVDRVDVRRTEQGGGPSATLL